MFPPRQYEYALVPIDPEPWYINRFVPRSKRKDKGNIYETFKHPFKKFTILTQVHPFPMLINAMKKISKKDDLNAALALVNKFWGFADVLTDVWDIWKSLPPSRSYTVLGRSPSPEVQIPTASVGKRSMTTNAVATGAQDKTDAVRVTKTTGGITKEQMEALVAQSSGVVTRNRSAKDGLVSLQ